MCAHVLVTSVSLPLFSSLDFYLFLVFVFFSYAGISCIFSGFCSLNSHYTVFACTCHWWGPQPHRHDRSVYRKKLTLIPSLLSPSQPFTCTCTHMLSATLIVWPLIFLKNLEVLLGHICICNHRNLVLILTVPISVHALKGYTKYVSYWQVRNHHY